MSEITITREFISQSSDTSVGSKFFTAKANVGGAPTQILNSAIRMAPAEFKINFEGPRGFYKLEEKYRAFGTQAPSCFFNFDRALAVDDYAVFSFHATNEWCSVAKLTYPISSKIALEIFKELINVINEYNRCALNRQQYFPLLFICKESVFVRFDDKGNPQVRLLPMLYDMQTQYPGLPREIFYEESDITADLYMAAYLYLEMKYAGGEAFFEDSFSKYDVIAERCLSPFKQRRYTLAVLMSQLADSSEIEDTKSNTKPSDDDEVVFYEYSDKADSERAEAKGSRLTDIIRGLGAKKKKIADTITDVHDKFDDMLSTEKGDEQEDDS